VGLKNKTKTIKITILNKSKQDGLNKNLLDSKRKIQTPFKLSHDLDVSIILLKRERAQPEL